MLPPGGGVPCYKELESNHKGTETAKQRQIDVQQKPWVPMRKGTVVLCVEEFPFSHVNS